MTTVATVPLAVSPAPTLPAATVTTTNITTSDKIVIVGVPGETITSLLATTAAMVVLYSSTNMNAGIYKLYNTNTRRRKTANKVYKLYEYLNPRRSKTRRIY